MILTKTTSGPTFTNAETTGAFKIRSSAKAFSILSSGLYANKIRAIIRELSCNAIDSHIAAGKTNVPFEVHLPSQKEPWFSVKDFGTGLSNEEVLNVYTTYFESTKTNSNEFIGALGLGSKSPFSYVEQFSIVAIKDNVKNIYTAFIDKEGVPSVTLLASQEGNFENGVEVKFAVNNSFDYSRFLEEAKYVFAFFENRPVITGYSSNEFVFNEVAYDIKDIVPGIHQYATSNGQYRNNELTRYFKSIAVMGNIAYPIEIPNSSYTLGDLSDLLDCHLVIHFKLGELDFQASREGLSYVPDTINAIKKRLIELRKGLVTYITKQANKFDNIWDKAKCLSELNQNSLFRGGPIAAYVMQEKLPANNGNKGHTFDILEPLAIENKQLQEQFNIKCKKLLIDNDRKSKFKLIPALDDKTYKGLNSFALSRKYIFIINDARGSMLVRAKKHYFSRAVEENKSTIVLLQAADKKQKVKYEEFIEFLQNPKHVIKTSDLDVVNRNGIKRGIFTVFKLVEETDYKRRRRNNLYKWEPVEDYPKETKRTYVVVKNKSAILKNTNACFNTLVKSMLESGIKELETNSIYGIRKCDVKKVQRNKDWIPLEDFIVKALTSIDSEQIDSFAYNSLNDRYYITNLKGIADKLSVDSTFRKNITQIINGIRKENKNHSSSNITGYEYLAKFYRPDACMSVRYKKLEEEYLSTINKYPLFTVLREFRHRTSEEHVVQYLDLIDRHVLN